MNLEEIGEVVERTAQCDPKTLKRTFFTYLDISSVDRLTKRFIAPQRIASNAAPSRARKLVEGDDVLISTVRPNLNTVVRVPRDFDGEIASTGFCVLRAKPAALNSSYLFYFTQTNEFVEHLTRVATGASYPAVSDSDIFATRIPLPRLLEQKRIAALLEKADRVRRARGYARQLSDTFLQSVFFQMFGESDWERRALEELAIKKRGSFVNGPFGSNLLTSEFVANGVPVIYIRDIREARYQRVSTVCVTPAKAEELKICQSEGGDVLVAKVGDPPGTAAIYPKGEPVGVITQDVIRIKLNLDLVTPEYLVTFLNSKLGFNTLKPIIVEGTRSRFGLTPFKELPIPTPPLPFQQKFADIVRRFERLRAQQREAERQAEHLFQTLLHRAFNGGI